MSEAAAYVEKLGKQARAASADLAATTGAQRNAALLSMGKAIRAAGAELIAANARDIAAATAAAMSQAVAAIK